VNRSIAAQQSAYLPPTSNEQLGAGTIVCCICQAAYTPSRSHAYLLQGPPIVLESALMSMCHFCFRCRRPSCPACWDEVHGVCGQCAVETGLPFRLEPAPLDGAQFTLAQPPAVPAQSTQPSLVNVQAGRFQRSSSPIDIDSVSTRPDVTGPVDIDDVPTRPDVTGTRPTARTQRSRPLNIDEVETRPDRKKSSDRLDITAEKTRPDRLDVAAAKTRPDRSRSARRREGRSHLLVVALLVLVVLLLVAALLLPDVNTFLRGLLHIDIRTGVARFWHMLQHLF
jgi:hypothetical protein